ncbi:MAG: 7-carboxy-7-deazaguanine synthase QueE [Bacteroidota bacterium]
MSAPAPTAVTYPVMEHFYTLQGEGYYTGCAAYFIRLGGCDVGCHWCDVKESWPVDAHPVLSLDELLASIRDTPAKIAVITGGEPLMHDLTALTDALHSAGLRTHIETSGTRPLSGALDWVTFSPKKFKAPLDAFYAVADELKVIVYNRHDLKWAQGHAEKLQDAGNTSCQLLLQPEWDTPEAMQWIVEHVKRHPQWRISLQTHKFLEIP